MELKAVLKSGDGGVIINQNSLTLSHSSLTSASFSLLQSLGPLSARDGHILKPLAIGLPAVHQQKTINCFIG